MVDVSPITDFLGGIKNSLLVLVILFLTFFVASTVKRLFKKYFNNKGKLLKVDPTQYNFLRHFMSAVIYIVGVGGAIYVVPGLRTISLSLFASAGIIAIVVGLAAQQSLGNIFSGISIVIFKPYQVGHRIKIKTDLFGVVEDITLRHTVIRNFENKRIVIPNSVISSEMIENASMEDEKICKFVEIGISYDSDVEKAMRIMQEEAMKHPNFIDTRSPEDKKKKIPAVRVRVMGYTDFAVALRAYVWTMSPGKAFELGTDLNKSIKKRFDSEGIEIPFPYRTIVYKSKQRKKRT